IDLAAAETTGPMTGGPPPPNAPRPQTEAAPEGASVSGVRFLHQPAYDRIIVELSGDVPYAESAPGATRSVLELRGAKLPQALQRTLDTSAFGGAVRSVSTYRRSGDPGRVVVDVERNADARGHVSREGKALVYTFSIGPVPSMVSGVGSDGGAARRARTVA